MLDKKTQYFLAMLRNCPQFSPHKRMTVYKENAKGGFRSTEITIKASVYITKYAEKR